MSNPQLRGLEHSVFEQVGFWRPFVECEVPEPPSAYVRPSERLCLLCSSGRLALIAIRRVGMYPIALGAPMEGVPSVCRAPFCIKRCIRLSALEWRLQRLGVNHDDILIQCPVYPLAFSVLAG